MGIDSDQSHGENGLASNSSNPLAHINLKTLATNDQVKELQTILRDKNTSRSDFKFYADRLIRLVIEESLNQLPFTEMNVVTPTGATYHGLAYRSGNCGVSIIRSGEAMEQGLRDCCRSIRIGKILVESDVDTHEAKVVYARFPEDIARRQVLLMYPIMSTGNTVSQAVKVLKEHGVAEENIILSNLFCTPKAAGAIIEQFPQECYKFEGDSLGLPESLTVCIFEKEYYAKVMAFLKEIGLYLFSYYSIVSF